MPVLTAVVHTGRYDIDPELLRALPALDGDGPHGVELRDVGRPVGYMDGSAAVIGEMMLPHPRAPRSARAVRRPATSGFAFQLTNFLRDVGEDLDRGASTCPAEDLAGSAPTRTGASVDAGMGSS